MGKKRTAVGRDPEPALKTSVKVQPHVWRRLRACAILEGLTVSQMIDAALTAYTRDQGKGGKA